MNTYKLIGEMVGRKIIEGNKLIAEFVGKEVPHTQMTFAGNRITTYVKVSDLGDEDWKRVMLCYHSSWNYLMPVVEKILKTDTGTLDVYSLYVSDSLRTANINDVFEAVIDYIKWYNKYKSKNVSDD
jgi:hypothetical protein